MAAIPQSVRDIAELSPIEDIVLAILRDRMPTEVPVYSLIPNEAPRPFVLVRRGAPMGEWKGDPRFVDAGRVHIDTFTEDPDGDDQGAVLSEACRVIMRDAGLSKMNVPGRGSIISCEMTSEPTRKSDWATASGPVQFADLPTGVWRYEAKYAIKIRKPLN